MATYTPNYVNSVQALRSTRRQADHPAAELHHIDQPEVAPCRLPRLSSPCGGVSWGLVW